MEICPIATKRKKCDLPIRQSHQPSTKSGEHRDSVRFLSGKVVHSEGAFSVDCTIRDLSVTGARIQLRRDTLIPQAVFLINIRDRLAYEGTVVTNYAWTNALTFVVLLALYHISVAVGLVARSSGSQPLAA